MKRIFVMLIGLMAMVVTMIAQNQSKIFKVLSLENVTKVGSNCDFDGDNCVATFKGPYSRWFDIPEISGNISEHPMLKFTVQKSNVILKICLRFTDEDGKLQQIDDAVLYCQMGSEISKEKLIKVDLSKKGNLSDKLKDVVSIRVSMVKACDGISEPWQVTFAPQVTLE